MKTSEMSVDCSILVKYKEDKNNTSPNTEPLITVITDILGKDVEFTFGTDSIYGIKKVDQPEHWMEYLLSAKTAKQAGHPIMKIIFYGTDKDDFDNQVKWECDFTKE